MNKAEQQFFALLGSGLWDIPVDTAIFWGEVDWEHILTMAKMQTVVGVVFDGIAKLPPKIQPPATLMRPLYQTVIRIEQSHELLNKHLTEIAALLQSEDVHPILLKGQGVAQNYPNPVRRQCGDIDLYVGKKDCEKSMELLLRLGALPDNTTEKKSPKHESFYLDEVNIELHFLVEKLRNPIYDKRFQSWVDTHLLKDKLRVWNLNGTDILLPPVNFDALYIFNHAYHHFIAGGIGLRQLCDWTLFLHTFNDKIDKEQLYKDLKSFGLFRAWQVFGCIAVHYLRLAEDKFPFYSDKYQKVSQKIVFDYILPTGNFGFYNPEHENHPSGFFSSKLHSLLLKQKWLIGILPIFTKDVLLFYTRYWYSGIGNIIMRR